MVCFMPSKAAAINPDNVGARPPELLEERLWGHIDPEVDYLEAKTSQRGAKEVLADIVDILRDSPQKYRSRRLPAGGLLVEGLH
jgi:hypothetical protein